MVDVPKSTLDTLQKQIDDLKRRDDALEQGQASLREYASCLAFVASSFSSYRLWALSQGSAYANAYRSFQEFVRKIDEEKQLNREIMFSFILAFIPEVMVGTGVGSARLIVQDMFNSRNGIVSVDALKNPAALQKAIDAAIESSESTMADSVKNAGIEWVKKTYPLFAGEIKLPKVPIDPLAWNNTKLMAVEAQSKTVYDMVGAMIDGWSKGDLPAPKDPKAAVSLMLTMTPEGGGPVNMWDLKPLPQGPLEEGFGRGMLANWIDTYVGDLLGGLFAPLDYGRLVHIILQEGERVGLRDTGDRIHQKAPKVY